MKKIHTLALLILIGKMLGVSTDVMIQGIIIIPFLLLICIHLCLSMILQALPVIFLINFGLACIGLTFASLMKIFEGFGLILTFINLPMFFLSGALFPLANVPEWLHFVSYFNLLTYGVDTLLTIMMGDISVQLFPIGLDIAVLIGFDLVIFIIGTAAFSRTE